MPLTIKGVTPRDVSRALADPATAWEPPTLMALTDTPWGDLSATDKRRIAGHFAWAAEMPPSTFGDLKLPHHRASDGAVVWRGVVAATARLNQAQIPSADLGAVRAHLRSHYAQFDQQPPDVLRELSELGTTCPDGPDGVDAADLRNWPLQRAYAVLTIKALDEDQRLIDGIASTPVPDRMGDIVESAGAQFTLPMPFLWQHRPEQPIGHVLAADVTTEGIRIRARIAKDVLPRIDEAWKLIKAGLVRGLSIGFKPLESEPLKGSKSFGQRFTRWEWLELSAVTIPANADAAIHTIKHYDVGLAAPRSDDVLLVRPSGVSDIPRVTRRDIPMVKTISERLTELKTARKTPALRMSELMQPVLEDGAVLDENEKKEYDQLAAQVETLDSDIDRLDKLERAQGRAALTTKALPVVDLESGSAMRGTSNFAARVKDNLLPGIEYVRFLMCKMAALRGEMSALEVAKTRFPDQPRIQIALKTAVTAGTTTDATWAGPLVYATNLTSEFIEFLSPQTIVGRFGTGGIPSLRRIPFNVRIPGQTAGGTANWVGQGKGKPVTKQAFNSTTLTWAKLAVISVFSEELARFSNPSAEMLIRDDLAAAIVRKMDTDFVDPDVGLVANVSPASITNNIAPLTASGSDAVAVRSDLAQLFAGFIAANINPTSGVFIMTNTTALALSLMMNALGQPEFPGITMNGGTLMGLPVITSQYAATGSPVANLLILVNAQDIFLADDGAVTIDASREATIEMSDNPENESGTQVNMYQTNQIALRAERYINWARRRDAAVQYFDSVAYVAGSPA